MYNFLYLSRKQFPALPTTTPVIPAWQLQQNSAERSIDTDSESRAESKPTTAVIENSENRTDAEPSLMTETITDSLQSTETAKDRLENKPEIIEVDNTVDNSVVAI